MTCRGVALLVSLLGGVAQAACSTDCVTLLQQEYRVCSLRCGSGNFQCVLACRAIYDRDLEICNSATGPTPPTCGRTGLTTATTARVTTSTTRVSMTSTTTTTGVTTTLPVSGFVCTEVLGFSQTGQWYLGPPLGALVPTFEPIVGDAAWELRAYQSAGVQWQNPGFIGWSAPDALYSPCARNASAPERVVLTISIPSGIYPVSWWVTNIQAEIATIRVKRPMARLIVLQPVVGGPHDSTCYFGRSPVHASVIHPTIDAAIAQVVGGDVITGPSPEVRTCADYLDTTGHLQPAARGPIASAIAQFYTGLTMPDITQGAKATSTACAAAGTSGLGDAARVPACRRQAEPRRRPGTAVASRQGPDEMRGCEAQCGR